MRGLASGTVFVVLHAMAPAYAKHAKVQGTLAAVVKKAILPVKLATALASKVRFKFGDEFQELDRSLVEKVQ